MGSKKRYKSYDYHNTFPIIIKKVRLDSHLETVDVFRIERLRERVCVRVCVMESVREMIESQRLRDLEKECVWTQFEGK